LVDEILDLARENRIDEAHIYIKDRIEKYAKGLRPKWECALCHKSITPPKLVHILGENGRSLECESCSCEQFQNHCDQAAIRRFAVRYGNYYPPEIESYWHSKELAVKRAEELGSMWQVEEDFL